MNILFLNAGRRCELIENFKITLQKTGGGTIYGSDISPLAPALQKVDQAFLFPKGDSLEFPEFLINFCKKESIHLVIPTIDPDINRLGKIRKQFNLELAACRLLIPPDFTIKMAQDKRESKKLFLELGVSVPKYCSTIKEDDFPVFVKPPSGSASEGARVISDRNELEIAFKSDPDLMVEQIIDGPEYTVDVLSDFNGNALIAIPRKRLKTRGGEVTQSIIERNAELEALAMKVAEGFQSTGPSTIQFRISTDGKYYAMEVNARMGGGLPLSIAAGADWPKWIIQLTQNQPIDTKIDIKDKLILSRYDQSVFISQAQITKFETKITESKRLVENKSLQEFKELEAWIFDMDDTLYPEVDFVFSGYHAVAQKIYTDFSIEIEGSLRERFLDGERGDLFSLCLKEKGIAVQEDYIKNLVQVYRNHTPTISPFVDVIPCLSCLKDVDKKLGLITDGWLHVQQNKLKSLTISHYFDSIIFSDSLGGTEFWKPSSIPFLKCLKEISINPENSVYIGDNPTKDFLGAKQIGMKTIRIKRHYGEYFHKKSPDFYHQPEYVIHELSELSNIF